MDKVKRNRMTIVNIQDRLAFRLLFLVILVGFFLLTVYFRPLIPIGETRYLAVAWEMWLRQDFIVPHLNSQPYSHKPPLLFWIIQGGWWLFGVHDWVARLVPALFAGASLFLLERLSRYLWPDDTRTARFAPLVLLSTLYWLLFTSTVMFDLIVGFFALLGLCGICQVWRSGTRVGWWIVGLAIGFGILAKGPVILVYIMPTALLAPLWIDQQAGTRRQWLNWYLGCTLALLLGAAIALAWALPAAYLGGEAFRNEILWGQTSGRLVKAFSHQQPWWWYLSVLPVMLYPWIFWLPAWRGLRRCHWDNGARFCATGAVAGFLIFSLVSGKQPHYLLPLCPALALLIVRVTKEPVGKPYDGWIAGLLILFFAGVLIALMVSPGTFLVALEWPVWVANISPLWGLLLLVMAMYIGIKLPSHSASTSIVILALCNIIFVCINIFGVMHSAWPDYNTKPIAQRIATLKNQQIPVATVSNYQGEFHFTGRLTQPIPLLLADDVLPWLANNPTGRLIVYSEAPISQEQKIVEHYQIYRGRHISLLNGSELLENSQLVNQLGYKK